MKMNPIIKNQLDKCKVAKLPPYDDNTLALSIPKGSALNVTPYQVHKCYLLKIADFILHPSEESTLASNWNGGRIPNSQYYYAEVSQLMAKMVKISGCPYDPITQTTSNDVWEGWIPQDGLTLLKELS